MRQAIQLQTSVLPGSRLELTVPELPVGEKVDVIIMLHGAPLPAGGSGVLDFLENLPSGPRSADSWDELERQLQAERDQWDR